MAFLFEDYLGQYLSSQKIADAREWFREKANSIESVNTQQIIKNNTPKAVSRIMRGHLYLFRYDPKLKQELPYYDIFPIIFVIDKKQDGFIGLNMHYLPFTYRARLMDALYEYVTGEDDLQRLKITYKILSSISKLRYYKPCLKYYLNNHVKSRFLHINPKEWDTAVFLPLHRFYKAKIQTVHKDSVAAIRKSNLRGINTK